MATRRHRCRWMRYQPTAFARADAKKYRKPLPKAQQMMCWQRGERVKERECTACLMALAVSRRDSHLQNTKGPELPK